MSMDSKPLGAKHVGRATTRVDGPAKVTGRARYAAELPSQGLLYGAIVNAAIARGKITRLDPSKALALDGVVQVFSHLNRPSLAWFDRRWKDMDAPDGSPLRPLADEEIHFHDQPIACVVATSLELARHAAQLVEVEYEAAPHETDLAAHRARRRPPSKWTGGRKEPPKPKGDADKALAEASHRIDVEYNCPFEHHNAMELFATTVIVDDDGTYAVYDKTQGTINSASYVKKIFGLKDDQVRVHAAFVGGAFGSALRPQHQLFFAMLAATQLQRSVRVTLSRHQMFTFGHRPATIQRVALGAGRDGKITAMVHEVCAETSRFEDYTETVVNWSALLYECPNWRFEHTLVPIDLNTPLDMRAPGAAWGVYAIESAIDELAVAAGLDPLELRRRNYTERDAIDDKDFGSKELRACWEQGAERFGWSERSPSPRARREGNELIGCGMASAVWDAMHMPARTKAVLSADGRLVLTCAVTDIGTGTYTVMTQIAADATGLPLEAITFRLGDSALPFAPLQGGSWTAVSVGSAVKAACEGIADAVFDLAKELAPFEGVKREDVELAGGTMRVKADPRRALDLGLILRESQKPFVEHTGNGVPNPKRTTRSHYAHSAVFVEVRVDEALGVVRVARVVSAIAAGKILNPKTAESQIAGGVVWGIGMALQEATLMDHRLGRFVNHSLAEYHVPVNKDVPSIDVIFVPEHDEHVNDLGAKGLGEIGLVGVAAAIANAIYNATGKRVRDLPFTLDKLL